MIYESNDRTFFIDSTKFNSDKIKSDVDLMDILFDEQKINSMRSNKKVKVVTYSDYEVHKLKSTLIKYDIDKKHLKELFDSINENTIDVEEKLNILIKKKLNE